MPIKLLSAAAFTEASPYDWYPVTWRIYAFLLGWERQRYPNAPVKLEARVTLRNN